MPGEEAALAAELESAETPDTPEQAAPEGTPAPESQEDSQPVINWEERYANLQPEYTRAAQEASQYRQLIDAARAGDPEALALLGVELEEDTDEYEDDDEPMTRAEFEAWQREQAEAAQAAEYEEQYLADLESHVESEIDQLAKEANVDLSDDEIDLIFGALTPAEDGQSPDVAKAFKKVTGLRDRHIQSYVKSKKSSAPGVGTAGTEKINLADDDARVELLSNLIEAGNEAE